jgi:hypothetical protein
MAADPPSARRLAGELIAEIGAAEPALLELAGVELAGGLEQQLFFALRDGRTLPRGPRAALGRMTSAAAPLAAAAAGLFGRRRVPSPGPKPLVVLVRDPAHYPVLAQIEVELQRAAGRSLAMLRVGRAASVRPHHVVAPRLVDLFAPGLLGDLRRHRRLAASRLGRVPPGWPEQLGEVRADELRRVAMDELARIALGAAALLSAARGLDAALLAAFDEIGTWARILPAVGRRTGIPSLDLPHAEAADPIAIAGAEYDRWAVYGPRAAAVLRQAGVPDARIVSIGAPRFDPLVEALAGGPAGREGSGRVVFAAQYVTGQMTAEAHRACYAAAVSTAAALAPATLVVVPHPAEPPGSAAALAAESAAPPGVELRIAGAGALHDELPSAELLVTGWSNSIFEAAIAGVPAIAVNPGGVAPVDFAADGLALGAATPDEAASAAAALRDPATRRDTVERARAVAGQRLGPLDGRASERAAALMLSLARMADA